MSTYISIRHRLEKVLSVFDQSQKDKHNRQILNVEDEYYLAIENRDTAIMAKEKENRELKTLLTEMDAQLTEKNQMLRSMARGLSRRGMTMEDIAEMMGKSKDEVRKLLAESSGQ